MGNCFNFSFVQHERRFDQRLAVSGRAGVDDLHAFRQQVVDFLDGGDGCSQRISFIVVIERIKECSVLAYKRCFRSRRSGINAQERLSLIGGKILDRNLMLRVAGSEFFEFCRSREERI